MWSEERVALLRKQLGGVTRNAVIGKVHRIGLAGRDTPSRPARIIVRSPRRVAPVLCSQRARSMAHARWTKFKSTPPAPKYKPAQPPKPPRITSTDPAALAAAALLAAADQAQRRRDGMRGRSL